MTHYNTKGKQLIPILDSLNNKQLLSMKKKLHKKREEQELSVNITSDLALPVQYCINRVNEQFKARGFKIAQGDKTLQDLEEIRHLVPVSTSSLIPTASSRPTFVQVCKRVSNLTIRLGDGIYPWRRVV